MLKKLFSLFAALTLCAGLWAETATNVPYIDANGNPQICPEATIVEGAKVRQASWAAGWYVVPNTGKQIKYLYDVVCNGAVHLILADGCDLWVEEGIRVAGSGKSLTIYGQSAQTGQLKADGGTYKPGIGTDAYAGGSIGQITINGGHITATGNADCAGIGGGWYMPGSNITINGGYVTATGGSGAPGIGSGVDGGNASNIFISSNCVVKAGSSDILTDDDLVEHTSSEDIASKLAGKQYVLAMEVIVPKIASITSNPTTPNAGHEVAFSATVANFSGVPTYSYEVKKEGGSYAAIQDGKFLPTMSGNYTVKVTATYSTEVAYKEQAFTVASPEVGDSIFYDNVYYTVTSNNPYTVEVGKNGGRFLGESVFIPTAVPCDGHDFVVTALGEGAFVSCSLDSLEIPASITYFGKDVFLQTYLFNFFVAWTDPSQLPTIHEDAFMIIFEYNNCTLYVPFGTKKMYEGDPFWRLFGVTKERVEPYHRIRQNGILYEVLTVGETNTVKVVADDPAYSNTSYTLPTTITYDNVVYTITEIGDNAFKDCSNVAEVTVAWTENLPTLGTDAFTGIASGAILHVPAGTKALYEADGWDAYFTITEPSTSETYTRTVANGDFGTLCLPWASVKLEGGIYYEVLGTKDPVQGVALVELGESDQLEAGKPYVFKATSEQIKVTYNPATEVEDEVAGNNIIGSFEGCNVPKDKYIIVDNLLYKTADATSTIGANRAYFDVDAMGVYTPSQAPGRKVVFMGGKTTPTDLETVDGGQCTMHNGKYIYKGRFVFVKDGKMYNALGM